MNTPTLGYEDDSIISKQQIATLQLTEAITLFLNAKFVCAITLAGAAEAIFAGLLAHAGQSSVVEDTVASIQELRKVTGLTIAENKRNNQLFNDWNDSRNKLKHHGKGENETVRLNLFDEAYWMIRRALANAEKLAAGIENANEFENWVIININM